MSLLIPKVAGAAILLLFDPSQTNIETRFGTKFFGLYNGMYKYEETRPGGYVYASHTILDNIALSVILANAGVIVFNKVGTITSFAQNSKVSNLYHYCVFDPMVNARLAELNATAPFKLRLCARSGIKSDMLKTLDNYIVDTPIDFSTITTTCAPAGKPIPPIPIVLEMQLDVDTYQFDEAAIRAHLLTHDQRVRTFKELVAQRDVIADRKMLCDFCGEIAYRIDLVLSENEPPAEELLLELWDRTIDAHRRSHDWESRTGSMPVSVSVLQSESTPPLVQSPGYVTVNPELLPVPAASGQANESDVLEFASLRKELEQLIPKGGHLVVSRGTPAKSSVAVNSAIIPGDRLGALNETTIIYMPGHSITRSEEKWDAFLTALHPLPAFLFNADEFRSKLYPSEPTVALFKIMADKYSKKSVPLPPSVTVDVRSAVEKTIPMWLIVKARRGQKWLVQRNDGAQVIPEWDLNVTPTQLVHDPDIFPSYLDYLKQVFLTAPASYVLDACM